MELPLTDPNNVPSLSSLSALHQPSDEITTTKRKRRTTRKSSNNARYVVFVTNLFLMAILSILILDAWPAAWIGGEPIRKLQDALDPLVDATGLWQGPWYLFSPLPPTETTYLSVTLVRYNPKTKSMDVVINATHWQSPKNWTSMTWWEKRRTFRKEEYFDAMREDGNQPLWEPLLNYLVAEKMVRLGGENDDEDSGGDAKVGSTITATGAANPNTTTTKSVQKAVGKVGAFAQLRQHWRNINGPQESVSTTSTGATTTKDVPLHHRHKHWLLGEKVQSTLGGLSDRPLLRRYFWF
mmetsp:Transcript_70084/g.105965  ORF Transcript_70084/g.105965 Transcript_70084/m.105965 type:complete len:296 (+) Transcript_70084:153-1040(+)